MSVRKTRLGDEIRDIIAGCFLGDRMRDPRLESVSITAVQLTGDLQIAKVYFRIYGDVTDKSIAQTQNGLESAAGFLRRQLADQLDVRRVPELRFFYDESLERAAKIEDLLTKI